jgi:prephenate dehydrogenase
MAASLGDVAIVGAGQIGTMLGMALMAARSRGAADVEAGAGVVRRVTLYDLDAPTVEASLARGAGEAVGQDVAEAFAADTVVLATPASEIVSLIDEFGDRVRPGALLLDTGSVKRPVVDAMARRGPAEAHAVGGHPLAGTERGGPQGARPELLAGAAFALSPARSDPAGLAMARAFVETVGAVPLEVDAEDHDRTVASTSHLPQLLATALALAVADPAARAGVRGRGDRAGTPRDQGLVATMASTGYLGASRLALSSPRSTASYLRANRDNLRDAVDRFRDQLADLVACLDDADELQRRLADGAAARRAVAGSRGP